MKIVRILAYGAAAGLLLVALLVGAALLPAVQRWAVLKVAAGRPGLKVEVDRISALPGSVAVRNLRVVWQGARVVLADASVSFSTWEAVAHRRVVIQTVRVTGLQADLTGMTAGAVAAAGGAAPPVATPPTPEQAPRATAPVAAPPGGERPAFAGVFKFLRLPLDVRVDQCLLEAEAVVPQAAQRPPVRARLKLGGGHLAPGGEAKFDFEVAVHNPDPASPVDTVEAHGVLTAKLGADRAFESVGLKMEAEARGTRLTQPARLQAEAALTRKASGETYAVAVSPAGAAAGKRLIAVEAEWATGAAQLTGRWTLGATDRQLAPFVVGVAVPEFSVAGEGRFELRPEAMKARLAGQLNCQVARLEVIDPRLRAYNGLTTAANFDVEYDDGLMRVGEFTGRVDAGKPVLSLRALQAFSLDLPSERLVAADPAKGLVQVKIEGVPVAWVQPWLPAGLSVTGEEVTAEWTVALRGDRIRLQPVTPLRVRKLALTRGGRALPASDISLDAAVEHARDETRVTLGGLVLQTADGDRLETTGEFSLRTGGERVITARAAVDATLPTLLASFAKVGTVGMHGSAAFTQSGDTLQVDRLGLRILAAADCQVMEVSSSEPFRFDAGSKQVTTVSGRPGELLRIKLTRIPLTLLQPYLGTLKLEGELAASEFVATVDGGKLHLAATAPLRVADLSAANAGQALVKALTIEVDPAVDYSPEGVAVKMNALQVRTAGDGNLLTAQAEVNVEPDFSRLRLNGSASFDLAVAPLAGQPALAGFHPPGPGKVTGEAKFSFDQNLLGEGRMTVNGFVSPATGEPLPVINLSFRAGLAENGDVAVQAPLLIDRAGERSDLTLSATVHRGSGTTFDAKVTSEHFVVDDVLALAKAFAPPAAGNGKPPPDVRRPDEANRPAATEAEWSGLNGQAAIDLKSIVYGKAFEVSELTGRLAIDPAQVTVEKLAGKLGTDGQLLLNAGVGFKAGDPAPYSSKVDLTVQEFEVGPVFKAMAPDQPPTVEGRFSMRTQTAGTGRTLEELIMQTHGESIVQSKKGIFRGLRGAANVGKTAGLMSGAANIVSGAARLFGSLGVVDANKAESVATQATRTASSTKEAQELCNTLAELKYDQLNARLTRDPSLNMRLSEFSVVSPMVRLQGEGTITHEAGKSIFDQPLQVQMNMSVMGTVKNLISRINSSLVTGKKDELGYTRLREPFVIGGTLDKPDTSKLYSLLF